MKKITAFCIGLALTAVLAVPAYAGAWRQDARGWWYQNDDGSYPAGTWQWIDGNGDGTAECYYFYSDGYMAYNNTIDGYYVNSAGQWEAGGRVQQKSVGRGNSGGSSPAQTAAALFRSAIQNRTWNSRGTAAQTFAVVDANNDGIMEVSVCSYEGWDDEVNSFLYFDGSGLRRAEFGEIEYIDSADPARSMIYTGRIRGKDIRAAYSYDPLRGVTYLDTWFLGYGDWENEAIYERYGTGMRTLRFVDATAANIDYYLSGSGRATGFENY